MAIPEILFIGGLVVGAAVSSIVYLDCARREIPVKGRLLQTVVFGALSFVGFLVPHVFSSQLRYVYFQVIKPRPVAVSPYEWLAVNLATGFLIGVALLLLYFTGSRRYPLTTFSID
ncbi:hypothetical protein ZOD2009_03400 [Haladaptatus paucihalophilus DX253]|uniref:Uncharacterized protein n=1 Tax=Haladaptatus paucihalophilus DX253 TaxID=797209 RepID=E7QNP0_HALPU|nr:hypothetical protein [Haladaptatus paucihalophilus]EFW94157.1 hypothetical protein ZOD2009_03400 [Haladaptatus paucihalophilus DX253]SHK60015.1 hypothetical protein SAMN05444342_1812 [Haladaptatus paucihalophilus DX253]